MLGERVKAAIAAWRGKEEVAHGSTTAEKEVPPVVLGNVGGVTGYTSYASRSITNVTTIGYLNNITVFRGVSVLAQSIAGLSWYVKKRYGRQERIEMHPLGELVKRPSLKKSRAAFMEQLVSYLLIGGTNYLYLATGKDKTLLGMYNLRPDLLTPVVGSDGNVQSYRYDTGKGAVSYAANTVQTIAFFNPLDELTGVSPLQVAAAVIERQNAGEQWNFTLMNNMARPSGAFVSTVDLPPITRGKMVREIQKKYGRGKETAGMPLLLENGLTYIQLGLSPLDADWFNSDNSAGRKILSALGVDSLLVNDKQYSTYNNTAEAKLAMWQLTGLPLLDKLEDDFNLFLPQYFGDDVILEADRSPIELLKKNRAEDARVVIDMWNNGLAPFNSCAVELGQPMLSDGDDFYKFGANVFVRKSQVGQWLDNQEERRNAPPIIGPPNTQVVVSGNNGQQVPQLPAPQQDGKQWDNAQTYVQAITKAFQQYFAAQEKELVRFCTDDVTASRTAFSHVLLQDDTLATLLISHYGEIGEIAAQELGQQFGIKATFYKQEAVEEVAQQVQWDKQAITEATQADIAHISASSGQELRDKILALYADYKRTRANMLGANIAVVGYNMATFIAAKQVHMPLIKTWNALQDGHTREWHAQVDGLEAELDSPFIVDGEELMYPHDVLRGASAYNTINCRCYATYRVNMKFNPNHDPHTGRFTTGNVGQVDGIPVDILASQGSLERMHVFGDPDAGDNPRFTTDVNGQEYFVKRLEGRVAGGTAQEFVVNELAARDMAVLLGLEKQTVAVTKFVGEDGNSYLAQPFMRGRKDAYAWMDLEVDISGIASKLSQKDATAMMMYEYLAGTADRHGGQYLIDPHDKKNPIILNDFDYGFPYHSSLDGTSWLMDELYGQKLDKTTIQAMAKQKKAVLDALKNSGLSKEQLHALAERFDVLSHLQDKDLTVRDFVSIM